MRKLNLTDFVKANSTMEGVNTLEYKFNVGKNEFRFRLIYCDGGEDNIMAHVVYSLGDNFARAKSRMEYSANGFKTKESAVEFLEQFISKMIRDGKTFIGLMRQYEIYD